MDNDVAVGPHPSHRTRSSDASTFDEICELCGAHDQVPGGWGTLVYECTATDEARKAYDAKRLPKAITIQTPEQRAAAIIAAFHLRPEDTQENSSAWRYIYNFPNQWADELEKAIARNIREANADAVGIDRACR